jgi:hypothetical protein
MKTLYVSDLDGTLLNSEQKTSDFTNETINQLVEKGLLFSYATARSYITASKVTAGLKAHIPVIVYNGAMVIDNVDGSFLVKNFFDEQIETLLEDLFSCGIYPIVYSFIESKEKFSYVSTKCTTGMMKFIESRKNDIRKNSVVHERELLCGEIFYITCIDEEDKLRTFYEKYKDKYHCVFQVDIYTEEHWLEIMPMAASKSNAIKQLKQLYDCEKVVVFGDGKNDIDMFEIADEAYAVANAVPELKEIATGIIESNNADGVAKYLCDMYGGGNECDF